MSVQGATPSGIDIHAPHSRWWQRIGPDIARHTEGYNGASSSGMVENVSKIGPVKASGVNTPKFWGTPLKDLHTEHMLSIYTPLGVSSAVDFKAEVFKRP